MSRSKIFISYANPDGVIPAEFIAKRLISMGYDVWIDRIIFKGGERFWPAIECAIKDESFHYLPILTPNFFESESTERERHLADTVRKNIQRTNDFIVPLRFDGIAPANLDALLANINWIDFSTNWADGLNKLVSRLELSGAPRSSESISNAFKEYISSTSISTNVPELLYSNHIAIASLPKTIYRYNEKDKKNLEEFIPHQVLFRPRGSSFVYTFRQPDNQNLFFECDEFDWTESDHQADNSIHNAGRTLLRKELTYYCTQKGLKWSYDDRCLYFPFGLLPKDKINFSNTDGRTTYKQIAGKRKYFAARDKKLKYHIAPRFDFDLDTFGYPTIKIGSGFRFTYSNGNPLPSKSNNGLRKRYFGSWFNHHWFSIIMALQSWFTEGKSDLCTIFQSKGNCFSVFPGLISYSVDRGIDEQNLIKIDNGTKEAANNIHPIRPSEAAIL